MERNIDNILKKYYNADYTEDDRLTKDNTHKIEFITTVNYIDKYLKKGDKILEVGAGTGAYSLYYARLGYEVEALELSQDNLNVLNSKITPELKINSVQGNAIDLSMYQDNTFDITLVLGPLYHIFDIKERHKVITYYEIGKLLSEAGNADGEGIIQKYADKVMNKKGGEGCFREFVEKILNVDECFVQQLTNKQ